MPTTVYPTIAAAVAAADQTKVVAPLTWNPVDHLLRRFTFGPTAADAAAVTSLGFDGWYAQQVKAATTYAGYKGNAAVAKVGTLLGLSPYDAWQALTKSGNQYAWTVMDQLSQVTLGLQAWSGAQLYETLVDFFSNHLNIQNHNGDLWITRHTHDRDVVRKYAAGSFTSMLLASARNPAMLQYLSLADSTKTAVNENYGRELLELHTIGLNYTESDVKNTAKLLTGRTLDQYKHYVYDEYIHGTGTVKVLGFKHSNKTAAGGEAAGDSLLKYLAAHQFTATNLARKLCIRYVSDTPSDDLVAAVAQAYLAGGTQILPMVSTILRTTEFWESRGQKVRRPTENVMATIRVLGLTMTDPKVLNQLQWMTGQMGNAPLDWAAPNGYPDVATKWRSAGTLLNLWGAHVGLACGWWGGLSTLDVTTLYSTATNSGTAITAMANSLTATPWSADAVLAMSTFLGETLLTALTRSKLSWMDGPMAGLMLDGPHFALR